MECVTCGITGRTDAGTGWALEHLKKNPGHVRYREHITRPYKIEPGAWR